MLRDLKPMNASRQSKYGDLRFSTTFRVLLAAVAALAFAQAAFAQQHYYTQLDHFGKLDKYAKVDGGGGSFPDFRGLPVPPIANKCGRNGVPCSGTGLGVGAGKASRGNANRNLDQIAKETRLSKNSSNRAVGSKPPASSRSGGSGIGASGSGTNASGGGSSTHRSGSSSSHLHRKRLG